MQFRFFFGGGRVGFGGRVGGDVLRKQTFQSWSSETDEVENNAASTHSCMCPPFCGCCIIEVCETCMGREWFDPSSH